MNFKTASKLNKFFELDKDFNILLSGTDIKIQDSMCKGYIYANLYFFDEVQKELDKLRKLIMKIQAEIVADLSVDTEESDKLLLELSIRVKNKIGDDSLDALVKEILASQSKHVSLMIDNAEREKVNQICEAIFIELVTAFFAMTVQTAHDLDNGVKTFKFSKEYIEKMTDRQKRLLAPALKMVGFENHVKLNNFTMEQDWTVKYVPEQLNTSFVRQEATIKDQIKVFIQDHQV